jgi:glycerophosphoryl diester phosphodiesterase
MTNKLPCIISITILVFIINLRTTIPAELSTNIMVIARHGSLEHTPENTFAAFEQALNIGVDGLEVDVRRTKDDRLILMHDDTIDRTTGGKGYVSKLLYDEIRLYDAGAWMGEEFAGERVPLLSDVLQFAKERNIIIILNVKDYGIELKILSLIEKFDMINQVYFSGRLDQVRSKNIGIQGTQLVFTPLDELTNEVIDFIHEKRKHVGISLFNTDDREKMKEAMVEGVDVLLTDYPTVAMDVLHYRTKSETKNIEPRKDGLETNIEGNTGQIEGLIDTITQGSPDESRMAALILSTLPPDTSVPALTKLLFYKDLLKVSIPLKKTFSIFNFKKKKEKKDNRLFSTAQIHRNIIWALGLTKNSRAVEPLIMQLEKSDKYTETETKREIIQALKMIGDKQALPALHEILLNREESFLANRENTSLVRYDAARALGSIASTDSIYTLIQALDDSNWMVKGACAAALAGTEDKRAIKKLKSILNSGGGYEASWARDRVAWSLARMGDEGLAALVTTLGSTGGTRACWALVGIGESTIPHMLTTLRGAGRNERRRVAMVLGWIGSKKGVVPLSWSLIDEDFEVRKAAAWAMSRAGGDKAVAALERALVEQDESDEDINDKISILNHQLTILPKLLIVLDKREMQYSVLKWAFAKEDRMINDRLKVSKDHFKFTNSTLNNLLGVINKREMQFTPLKRAFAKVFLDKRKMQFTVLKWAFAKEDRMINDRLKVLRKRFAVLHNEERMINDRLKVTKDRFVVSHSTSALKNLLVELAKREMQFTEPKWAFGNKDREANNQLRISKDRFVVSDSDLNELFFDTYYDMLTATQRWTSEKDDKKISERIKVSKDRLAYLVDSGLQRDITKILVMLAHKEDIKNKFLADIKQLNKSLQRNNEVREYAKEAIQRIKNKL